MDWISFFICFTGWTLGGIVNGISGLGAGIFALPIVLLVTDIKTASLITCIICIPLPAILGWQFRHYYRMADLRLLLLGTIPGALLGVALLPLIPARVLQIGLGLMLMAHMIWHLLAHRPGPLRSPLLWGSVSGAVAGFIQAVSGLGGPAIGMYAQLAHWASYPPSIHFKNRITGICNIRIVRNQQQHNSIFFYDAVQQFHNLRSRLFIQRSRRLIT